MFDGTFQHFLFDYLKLQPEIINKVTPAFEFVWLRLPPCVFKPGSFASIRLMNTCSLQ